MKPDEKKLKERLSNEAYRVTQTGATEAPFSGELLHNKEEGAYRCIVCGNTLFSSETKFDSGSGWPSFYDLAKEGSVEIRQDTSLGMVRDEAVCANCGAHLGHVFPDGPQDKTGLRYCINSCALDFDPEEEHSK